MKVFRTGLALVLALALTVPWWDSSSLSDSLVPVWAVFSIAASIVVVCVVALYSKQIWNTMGGDRVE